MDFKVSDKLMREQSFLSDQQRHFFSKFYFLTKLQKMHNYMRKESLKIFRLAGVQPLTSAIPVQRFQQLSWQPNWEMVIKLVRNIPGKDEDEIINM